MFFIKLLFILIVFFVLLFIFLQNSEEDVTLYFFNYTVSNIQLYWVMFYTFIAGAFFAWVISAFQEIKYRYRIYSQNREIENLNTEIHNLRKMSLEEEPPGEEKDEVV